jgi:hypothetical protein
MERWSWDEISCEVTLCSTDEGWEITGEPVYGVQEWRSTDGRNVLSLTVEADTLEEAEAAIVKHPAYADWEYEG